MGEDVRVRVNFSAGEVELAGSADAVRGWWQMLDEDVVEFRQRFAGRANARQSAGAVTAGWASHGASGRRGAIAVPETFGELIHQFPSSVTDIERALIAGLFVQTQSENNTFSTAAVNELLLQHGVRLANASSSIKRNVDARRAILLGGGQFRVSQSGLEHLERLRETQN